MSISVDTLSRSPTSSLKITNRSFCYASPHLWNQLSVSFRQPCINLSAGDVTLSNNSSPTCSPYIMHSLFHSRLKIHFSTNLFHHSLLASTHLECLLGLHWTGLSVLNGFSFFCYFSFLF